jgi:hypothetical protein
MNPRLFESFEGSRLGVGQSWFGAALRESPMTAAGPYEQEFDAAAADPVTNRGHLFASPQLAELRKAKELSGTSMGVGPVRDQTWFSGFRDTSTHNCRVHDLVRVCLEHSLVLGDFRWPGGELRSQESFCILAILWPERQYFLLAARRTFGKPVLSSL